MKRINFLDKYSFENENVFAVLLSIKRKRFFNECSIHINEKKDFIIQKSRIIPTTNEMN